MILPVLFRPSRDPSGNLRCQQGVPLKKPRFLVVFLFLAACTSVVPKELVDARVAYARASAGPAARLSANAFLNATEAIAEAEWPEPETKEEPDSGDEIVF